MKKADFGIFRSFMRGKSVAQIAEEKGIDAASVWKQIGRTVARLQKHGGVPLDLKLQQYLQLSHVVDQALEAFRESQESGLRKVLSTTLCVANCYSARISNSPHTGQKVLASATALSFAASREARSTSGPYRFFSTGITVMSVMPFDSSHTLR